MEVTTESAKDAAAAVGVVEEPTAWFCERAAPLTLVVWLDALLPSGASLIFSEEMKSVRLSCIITLASSDVDVHDAALPGV